jgi:nicotinamide mononucleotide transporter
VWYEVGLTLFGQKIAYTELVGQVLALAVVFLAQRRSLLTWPVQLVSVALLFTVYLSAHLGGLATRQIVVGLIAVYGWYAWVRHRDPVFGVVVRSGSWRERAVVAGVFVVGTVAFALMLDALDASWAPWPDAAIFVGTILAFALQGLGLVEFWLVWLLVDAVGVPLQIKSGLYFSAFVYLIFAGLVIHGFFDWTRTARRLTEAAKSPL